MAPRTHPGRIPEPLGGQVWFSSDFVVEALFLQQYYPFWRTFANLWLKEKERPSQRRPSHPLAMCVSLGYH